MPCRWYFAFQFFAVPLQRDRITLRSQAAPRQRACSLHSACTDIAAETFAIVKLYIKWVEILADALHILRGFFHILPFLIRRDAKSPLSLIAQRVCFDGDSADDYSGSAISSYVLSTSTSSVGFTGTPYSPYLPMSPLLRARMWRCCGETPHQRRTVRLKVGMEV